MAVLGTVWNLPAAPGATEKTPPTTPLAFYNDGTKMLREGKLREAEALLQTAVASQQERVQPPALYNLGHARFQQGVRELTNGPSAAGAGNQSQHARASGDGAIHAADDALAQDDLQTLLAAYMRGRGAQKELKAATEAVKRAMESYRNVLQKWERASGDFKSAHELNPSETDAQWNAEVVDRSIARLVDIQQRMMQSMGAMGKQRSELREKMGRIKKRLPQSAGDQLKGGDDDEDDDEDGKPKEPKPGLQEGPSRDGQERVLSLDEAERLLGMLRLDSSRKLPLGLSDTETIKRGDRKGRDW